MRGKLLFILAILLATSVAPVARAEPTDADLKRMRAERRVALVIGNGAYADFDALPNPPNDARGVAKALEAAGFRVTLRVDANRADMLAAIEAFGRDLSGSDVGLFYFAGHAAQVDWRNFVVPVAARLSVNAKAADRLASQVAQQAVELGTVLDLMGAAKNRLNIVIVDACRNNPFTTKAIEVGRSIARSSNKAPFSVGAGLAQTFAPPRTFLAYATAPGEVASDGEGGNSPYSGALIEALGVADLKLEDVFKRVRSSVATATANSQIPWDNSSVFDDFYFRVPASALPANARRAKSGVNTTFVSP